DVIDVISVGKPVDGKPATLDAMVAALQPGADIFAFAGHGVFDQANQQGQLLLEKPDGTEDRYDGAKLGQLLSSAGVRLAVLGACLTGRRSGRFVWGGVAPVLTSDQIPAVIANQFTIGDKNAGKLAGAIYPLVLGGYTVDEAVFAGRQAVY